MTDERSIPALDELRAEVVRVADQAKPSRRLTRPALALGAVSLIAIGVAAGVLAGSDDDQAGSPAGPSASFDARGTYYESEAQLFATTDLVVTGTVKEVTEGRTLKDDDEFPTRYLNTVVEVGDALKGPGSAGTVVVETRDLAFGDAGGQEEWRQPGESVILFLSPSKDEPGLYTLSNSGEGPNYEQATYLLEGDELLATGHDPIAEEVASKSVPELEQAIQETPDSEAKSRGAGR